MPKNNRWIYIDVGTNLGNFCLLFFSIDKPKALSLVLHCADISHPAKDWDIHKRWTDLLLEEFFRQVKKLTLCIPHRLGVGGNRKHQYYQGT